MRSDSTNSYGFFSVMSDGALPKKSRYKKGKSIAKIITIIIVLGFITYLFFDYDNFNEILSNELYEKILKNYDKIGIYADIIDYLTNYHIFFIFFMLGFCLWNIFKSFIHVLGFFIIEFFIFILKLIFMKKAKIFDFNLNNYGLSVESINDICELTSEYECPSYRAAYVIYSYMSFICLLFKEKKLRNRKLTRLFCKLLFIIICIILNISLIFLLQSTIGSILIGSGIGFIIYFFMFSFLKIDYDRNEQMLKILNFNIIFYLLINLAALTIILFLYFFLDINDKEEKENFLKLCKDSTEYYKEMSKETLFKCIIFFSNLTMIICIKLQRKFIFQSDGDFLSRNFNIEEIVEQNNLISQIKGEESLKFNTKHTFKYLCKILICLGIALFLYLICQLFKYFREDNYNLFSIMSYMIPLNVMIIFLFLFSKRLFIYLDLEIYSYSD